MGTAWAGQASNREAAEAWVRRQREPCAPRWPRRHRQCRALPVQRPGRSIRQSWSGVRRPRSRALQWPTAGPYRHLWGRENAATASSCQRQAGGPRQKHPPREGGRRLRTQGRRRWSEQRAGPPPQRRALGMLTRSWPLSLRLRRWQAARSPVWQRLEGSAASTGCGGQGLLRPRRAQTARSPVATAGSPPRRAAGCAGRMGRCGVRACGVARPRGPRRQRGPRPQQQGCVQEPSPGSRVSQRSAGSLGTWKERQAARFPARWLTPPAAVQRCRTCRGRRRATIAGCGAATGVCRLPSRAQLALAACWTGGGPQRVGPGSRRQRARRQPREAHRRLQCGLCRRWPCFHGCCCRHPSFLNR